MPRYCFAEILLELFKIHITMLLRVLSGAFRLFFGHVATATLPHHKQKSIRQSFSKSVSYKFKQFLRDGTIIKEIKG